MSGPFQLLGRLLHDLSGEGNEIVKIIEHSRVGVVIVTPKGKILYANSGLREMLGYEPEEMTTLTIADITFPEDREITSSRIQSVLEGEVDHFRFEKRYLRNDGTLVWADITAGGIRDESGNVAYLFGMMQDITQRKQGENELQARRQALQHQKLILESMLNSIPEGVIVADRNGKFVLWNPAAERIVGIGAIDAPPEDWSDEYGIFLADGETRCPPDEVPLVQAIAGRTVQEMELVIRNKEIPEGTRVSCNATPIKGDQGTLGGGVVVFRDVGEERELQEELIQSKKMEAIGLLAGGVAHYLNNVLQVTLGQSTLIRQDLGEEHPVVARVEEIVQATERGADIIRELRSFAAKHSATSEPVNLNRVIAVHEPGIRKIVPKGVRLDISLPPQTAVIRSESRTIERILDSLVENAVDAMPDGGTLRIKTGRMSVDTREYLLMEVSDTGTGMSEEVRARIFEPFFTTKDIGEGTGLGLASCHSLVRQLGGHITVSTEPGKGSTFQVQFPATG